VLRDLPVTLAHGSATAVEDEGRGACRPLVQGQHVLRVARHGARMGTAR
jgi:hypothetical protein